MWATKDVEPRTWKEQFSQIGPPANNQLSDAGNPLGAGSNDDNDVGTFIGNALLYSAQWGEHTPRRRAMQVEVNTPCSNPGRFGTVQHVVRG